MKLYKICPKCSYFCREEEKDEYCSICGDKLISTCQNCGEAINNPYAEYCKKCGKKYRYEKKDNKPFNF